MSDTDTIRDAVLIYDGDCPFCSNYVRLLEVRKQVDLRLLNAREGGDEVMAATARGYDLDKGFVLRVKDRYYYGDECMHVLAMLSTPTGWFNRLNRLIFSRPALARMIYPVLRTGRNITLRLLGKPPLDLTR